MPNDLTDRGDLSFVVKKLNAVDRDQWKAIAKDSGVPHGTLKKVGTGATPNPTFDTVFALANYFRKGRKGRRRTVDPDPLAAP